MSTILLEVSQDLQETLERRAREEGLNLGQTIVRLIGVALSRPTESTRHHDLDGLAGTWSAEQAKEFDAALASQRQVDPEIWR